MDNSHTFIRGSHTLEARNQYLHNNITRTHTNTHTLKLIQSI